MCNWLIIKTNLNVFYSVPNFAELRPCSDRFERRANRRIDRISINRHHGAALRFRQNDIACRNRAGLPKSHATSHYSRAGGRKQRDLFRPLGRLSRAGGHGLSPAFDGRAWARRVGARPGAHQRHRGLLGYAKSRLSKFRGMSKRTFYLHLKECEFRFNHRHDEVYEILLESCRKKPIKLS